MKIPILFALTVLASASVACAQAETPATAHRADPRSAAQIQRANLLVKSFPASNPVLAKDRADIPIWWQSTLDERDTFLAAHLKKGDVINSQQSKVKVERIKYLSKFRLEIDLQSLCLR